jgi:steroid 5-alpha reductase family enzyme
MRANLAQIVYRQGVIEAILLRIAEAWLLCAAIQALLWGVAQRTRNAAIVDVGWALSFTAVVALFGAQAHAPRDAYLPIGVLVVVWSTRLGSYLIDRGAIFGTEEGRYVELRRRWALGASRKFYVFFQIQALLTGLLSTAFVVPFLAVPTDGGVLRIIGAALSAIGIAGEAIADAQLARWKRDPNNLGRVCDAGLWGWSRHPNYFFEWCVWVGFAVYGFAFENGWIAVFSQGLIFATIWKVTGIPATEDQAMRSKGEQYRAYQARVSKFVPFPPRS